MRTPTLKWKDGARERPGVLDGAPLTAGVRGEGAIGDIELGDIELRCGASLVRVDELFTVEWRESDGPRLEVPGCERWFRLGAGWSEGDLVVRGHGGHYVGAGQSGGCIEVEGDAGHAPGAGMRGGLLRVAGDAGDGVGGPLPGEPLGARGGEIVVRGHMGARAGHRMRRGTIVALGGVGPECALELRAGTIVSGAGSLVAPGVGMVRGTIVAFGAGDAQPAGFRDAGLVEPVFWRVLARRLASLGVDLPLEARFWSSSGDHSVLGRGEILIHRPVPEPTSQELPAR